MENIKVTVEEPGSVTRKITVEVPVEEVDRVFQETYREYRRQAVLPGFRKGKAPMDVIEKRFRDDVTEEEHSGARFERVPVQAAKVAGDGDVAV